MSNPRLRKALLFGVTGIAGLYVCFAAIGVGLAVNLTNSMPRGLYATTSPPGWSLPRGALIAVCIPNIPAAKVYLARRYLGHSTECPVGMPPEIKPLGAVPGDLVEIGRDGVRVNGVLVPNSRLYGLDSNGRPISHLPFGWKHRLRKGEYFTLATYLPRSLDSRYYGPVSAGDIIKSAWPVLTAASWGSL